MSFRYSVTILIKVYFISPENQASTQENPAFIQEIPATELCKEEIEAKVSFNLDELASTCEQLQLTATTLS